MKTIVALIVFIVMITYIAEPTLTFKPFSLKFEKPYMPFAWIFLVLAIVFFQIGARRDGYKEGLTNGIEAGYKAGSDHVLDLIKKSIKKEDEPK